MVRDGAEPVIGPRVARTRWRLLTMETFARVPVFEKSGGKGCLLKCASLAAGPAAVIWAARVELARR